MIHIHNLHFAYGKKQVFTHLNLQLQPGHIYGLLGSNGTGKSTLLRIIAGLLSPWQGTVKVADHIPGQRTPAFLQEVFFIPEDFSLPNLSISDFVRNTAPFYPAFQHTHFVQHLAEFSLLPQQQLQELSYGQQKKVLISFALACHTTLLLMDEPTNGLDMRSKSTFRKLIAGAMEADKYILISTHQVKDLENLIDRVTIIDQGAVLFDQTIDAIQDTLRFTVAHHAAEAQNALYTAATLHGQAVIVPNTGAPAGIIDLEMLHRAIVENDTAINALFHTIHPPVNA